MVHFPQRPILFGELRLLQLSSVLLFLLHRVEQRFVAASLDMVDAVAFRSSWRSYDE
jgi:hypothetical protein